MTERVETNTKVQISGREPDITMKKIHLFSLIIGQLAGLIIFICISYYFIMKMDDRITVIENERSVEKSNYRELLRLTQENNINLQIIMEDRDLKYKTVPKGE